MRIWVFSISFWSLVACEMGTIPEEEVILDYRVMPIDPLDIMIDNAIQALQSKMNTTSIQFLSIGFNTDIVFVTVVHPNKQNRVYDYSIRGTTVIDSDLTSEKFNSDAVFTVSDFPHDMLSALADKAHAKSGLVPGAFCGLRIERKIPKLKRQLEEQKSPYPLTLTYCIMDGLSSSEQLSFDHDGNPL